ncbi:hypothetical protein BGZ83_010090 [Gryganskiella cystojenkinii]|nr:hypothetical protein BGZ83_010090 [Gryganskiella cystojenkinii]
MDCHSPYSSQLLRHKITLWHAVSGLKQLSTLKIQVAHIQSTENLTWFWKICTLPSLQALTLQRVILEDLDHDIMVNEDIDQHQQEQQQQQSWQIRHLTIKRVHGDDQSIARLFELLGRSPKLCSLVWESFGSKAFRLPHYAFLPLAQGFRDSTYFWPTTIRKLYIQCDSVEDSDMAAILSTASGGGARLTELVFENGAFGDRSLTALLQNHHTETLTHVDLHKSITTGQVTHSVLCTCPRLVSIHGVKMSVNLDILPDNRPWVCEDLEEWHVAIEMDDDKETDPNTEEVETQQQQITFEIFSRLSNLKKIRKLDLESRFYRLPPTRRPQRDLPFRLDWGMDQLESLQNLELLTINETRGNILTDDLWSWLMSTFPRLRMVSGIDVHRGEMDLEFWRYRLEDSR